jgi:predicted RNase H-like nuclease (RuvC/YqgF family)
MSIFRPLLEGFKSLSKATKNYYSAWSTLGHAFKLKAEAELLDAVSKKIKIDEEYSQLSDKEVEQAKEVIDALSDKLKNERHQIILLSIPLVLFLFVMYALTQIVFEVLRIIFS